MGVNLKSIVTFIIVIAFSFAFGYVVVNMLDEEMAKTIVSSFLTVAVSVIGFFIGYQTNKPTQIKDETEVEDNERTD